MSHTFEVAFAIGAALQSGFKASIGQAVSQVNKLGKEVAALGAQKNTAQKFQDMAARVESTRVEMKKAQDRVRELKNEISATSNRNNFV